MASLFVSHSSQDAQVTAELVGRLRAAGFQALFVDFDPDSGIPAGRSWERELYAQLRRADGVLYVASPAANASRWCFAELSLARSIGRPIFPVLVAGSDRLSLLADVQWVDLRREDGGAGLQRLLHGLQRGGLDARDGFGWDPGRSPYPGLDPFGAEDAAVFFGRTAEIGELLDRLTPTLQRGRGQFLAVVGPSGCGKSSLVAAGLLPHLARRGWATLPRVVPGERPLTHLARSLAQAFPVSGGGLGAAAVERRLEEGGSPGLVELAQHLLDLAGGSVGAVVFVDQAEELITRTGTEERTRFLRLLRGALQPDSPLWVVATLRSEFLGPSLVGAGLAEIVDDTVVVGPLARGRLFEVIEKPARRAGLDFEAGLVPRIVDDTVGGDSLPLLAYTLRQLSKRAEPGRPIRHGDYEAVGGVVGALRRQADGVVRTLAPRHPQNSVLAVLLRLASVERGGEPVRRRVRREALRADEDEIVQAFVDARLLRSDELDDEVVVEVAHEALLRRWEPLRAAVETSRRTLELRAEIEEDARSWDQAGRENSYLLRGVRLAAVEELSEDYVHDLGVLEQEFLSASRALAGKELETARRSNRRLRRLAAGLITFLVLAVTASSLAVVRTVAAERAEQKARSRQLAAQALALLDTRPDTALLLALEGVRTGGTEESITALQIALNRPYHVATRLTGHEDRVWAVVFSPDGTTVASASADRTVRLWEVGTRRALGAPLRGHEDRVWAVVFSPDGTTLASASADGTVRLWRLATASWVPEACRLANRNLSRFEWDVFVGYDAPYVRTCPALPSGQGSPSDAPGAHYEQAIWRTSPT